jgi:hypothetical protein
MTIGGAPCGHVAHDTAPDGFRIGYRYETNGDLHGSEPCPEPSAVEAEREEREMASWQAELDRERVAREMEQP